MLAKTMATMQFCDLPKKTSQMKNPILKQNYLHFRFPLIWKRNFEMARTSIGGGKSWQSLKIWFAHQK